MIFGRLRVRAFREEQGNLWLRETSWWAWEDSNFQPNDYQLLPSEVPKVSGFECTSALSPQTAD
jgi:hypothetical protein